MVATPAARAAIRLKRLNPWAPGAATAQDHDADANALDPGSSVVVGPALDRFRVAIRIRIRTLEHVAQRIHERVLARKVQHHRVAVALRDPLPGGAFPIPLWMSPIAQDRRKSAVREVICGLTHDLTRQLG